MKTLCIDARMLFSSGIGTYLQNLLPFFDQQYKIIILGNEKEISSLNLKNSEIIPIETPIYSIKEQLLLPLKIPSTDLFWSPHYNAPLFPIRAKKRIVTIHDAFHLKFYDVLSNTQKIYAKIFLSSAAKISDTVVTVSDFSKKELIKYLKVSEEKIHVVHNGVSSRFRIAQDQADKSLIKTRYSLPDKFILFVGNVKPHKNITMLIEALALLKSEDPEFEYKLVILGKRKGLITSTQNLEDIIRNKGLEESVIFAENVETQEMAVFYSLASLLVFPSIYEGFGLPPLEAMSCGCPTVVSDIECFHEIYRNETVYVSPFSAESIQKGISNVLKNADFRKDLIRRGIEYSKKYTWESSASKHLHIFEKTLYNK